MSETYLPVKESLGYKNVKTALLNIFQMEFRRFIYSRK